MASRRKPRASIERYNCDKTDPPIKKQAGFPHRIM